MTKRPGAITGNGVSHIKNNMIAGRVTLAQMRKMLAARQQNVISEEGESEQDRMRKYLKRVENLNAQIAEIQKTVTNHIELERRTSRCIKEKEFLKNELIMHLKRTFRHIKGMNPKTARFESE